MEQPIWYRKTEEALAPVQPLVIFGLVMVIIISVALILSRNHTARTAWLTYLIMP